MKLLKLLNRYLDKASRRARMLRAAQNGAAATEACLEPRVLLSGTGISVDEPTAEHAVSANVNGVENVTTIAPSEPIHDLQRIIEVYVVGDRLELTSATATSLFSLDSDDLGVVTKDTSIAGAPQNNTPAIDFFFGSLNRRAESDGDNQFNGSIPNALLLPDEEYRSADTFDDASVSELLYADSSGFDFFSEATSPLAPFDTGEASGRSLSQTDFASYRNSTSSSIAAIAAATEPPSADVSDEFTGTNLQSPKARATGTGNDGRRIHYFVTDSISGTFVADTRSSASSKIQLPRTDRNREPAQSHADDAAESTFILLSSGSFAVNVQDASFQPWQTSTSSNANEFRSLLNSFVQLDTLESVASEITRLSDWLTEQLDSKENTVDATVAAESTTTDVYAEPTAQQSAEELNNQYSKHAWSRIKFGDAAKQMLVMLSENPLEPPEISGIWQRLKFDCNPRGPPASEGLSASELTRLTGCAIQLQQLRYSISPRGPSVASVN